jgi:hypothetical protein
MGARIPVGIGGSRRQGRAVGACPDESPLRAGGDRRRFWISGLLSTRSPHRNEP